jgi:iron complex transport system substrate-binding protein
MVDREPRRIVSLAPSLTEILYYLDLETRVVGVTRFSYYPPQAAGKPKVGSYVNLNVEKILSLNPDLVIGTADGNEPGVVELLEHAGIPVFIVNPRNVREAVQTVATLGDLCGVGKKGRELADDLDRRIDRIREKTAPLKKPLVFLQINVSPIMTVNKHTFHQDVIRLAGGENMSAEATMTYPRISVEEVIRRKPDVIIISSMQRDRQYIEAREKWFQWPMIPAVRDGRVHLVDSDLLDRPSPRVLDGLEMMARLLHPEVKWK